MPIERPKALIIMEKELLRRVDDFPFENRFHSRSGAIRRLLDEALKKYEKKPKKCPFS